MRRNLLIFVLCILPFAGLGAQTVYVDASAFPIYGKATANTSATYERLPSSLEGVVRDGVWSLGHHSAGISVRFRSNSSSIRLRWVSFGLASMNHMTDTGTRGLDLYAMDPSDGSWRFVRSARPAKDTLNDQLIVSNMEPVMREYLVYLSLYEGVRKLEIGVDEGSVIEGPAVDSPRKGSPIVMYGTSILQGGCANRPGMAFTNIISRELDREVVNLGFSGNAKLDYEIAGLMAAVEDPCLFVLDNVPNCSHELIEERQEKFFRILRDAHPDVPVVFVENPNFPHLAFDREAAADYASRNASFRAVYDKLVKAGEKNLHYVKGETMLGTDGEATVDGVHFTDLGMVRYAELVLPTLRKALGCGDAAVSIVENKDHQDKEIPGVRSEWNGYDRFDFQVDGRDAILVRPKVSLEGNPWIWRPAFFGAFPSVDIALLSLGYHVAYYDLTHLYGSPRSVELGNKFHSFVTEHCGLAQKVVVEGLSRGGLFAVNWASRNPEKVSCIYLDAPVCDITSWPGRERESLWKDFLAEWGLTEEGFASYHGNPLDNLEPLAKAKVPIIGVSGDSDKTVPYSENLERLVERYRELGGESVVILKPGCDHHPHSLDAPAPIVRHILDIQYSEK